MRPSAVAVLLVCGAADWLSSCSSDAAPPTAQPAAPGRLLADAAPACGQPLTHPTGLVLDSVATPPAWGIAVRDDGVGITSTQTRTLDGFIPTGQIPTGVDFAPDGATAYVTNQYSYNVGVIGVASAQQVATIPIPNGASPFVVRVSPDGSRLFISTSTTTD